MTDADISSIMETIQVAAGKDYAALALKMNTWKKDDIKKVKKLLDSLQSLPPKKKSSGLKKNDSEVARVLQTMQQKLEENENRGVRVEVDSIMAGIGALAADLRERTAQELVQTWKRLEVGVANIVKAMLQFEQARLIESLLRQHNLAIRELAATFDLTERKVREFSAFYKFCGEFPGLLFTTYTMGTITKHQKAIKALATQDERFSNLLKTQQESIEIHNGNERSEVMLNRWFEDDLFLHDSYAEGAEHRLAEEAHSPGLHASAAGSGSGASGLGAAAAAVGPE